MAELTPDRLPEEEGDFDTMDLLEAVDHLDQIRYRVADQEDYAPPEVREQLMELHELIFGLMREGQTIPDELHVRDLIDAIRVTISPIVEHTERILTTLRALEQELPEPRDEFDAAEADEV